MKHPARIDRRFHNGSSSGSFRCPGKGITTGQTSAGAVFLTGGRLHSDADEQPAQYNPEGRQGPVAGSGFGKRPQRRLRTLGWVRAVTLPPKLKTALIKTRGSCGAVLRSLSRYSHVCGDFNGPILCAEVDIRERSTMSLQVSDGSGASCAPGISCILPRPAKGGMRFVPEPPTQIPE